MAPFWEGTDLKIVVTFPCDGEQEKRLREAVKDNRATMIFSAEKEQLQTADVIIGEPDLEDIYQNPDIKWIQMTWAGTDKYTTKKALENGKRGLPKKIQLSNASGAFGEIMSEYALGAVLSVCHRFPAYQRQQEQRIWKDAGAEEGLSGKTVLLLGTGNIGTMVARRCKAFDMYTIGVRRHVDQKPDVYDRMHEMCELDEILPEADFVICSLPDKPNTRGLLTKQRLLKMKKNAVLVNMGRGTILNCTELDDVLKSGHLKAAILDVTNPEPLPRQHPLWDNEKVMITPHIAGPSIAHAKVTQNHIIDICCENLKRFFAGEEVLHLIQDEDFEYERV